jgi:purine-binding chemotaxis protein CheW
MSATVEPKEQKLEHLAGKYLTFRLATESYAIPVLDVREIIRHTDIRRVPQMPPHIKGVINLRGKIIPISDLRLRFGMPDTEVTELTCIIVVQVNAAAGQQVLMGLIVDAVEAVMQIHARDLEPPPEFGTGLLTDGLLAMAKADKRVVTLLDTRQIVLEGSSPAELPMHP